MITRRSEAEWRGTIKDGAGTVALGSGAFSGDYSFASRFENGAGTNPEELLGAAHAGCYSMALSMVLSAAGFPPRRIKTSALVHISSRSEEHTSELQSLMRIPYAGFGLKKKK